MPHKAANCKSPCVSDITRFLVNNRLNILFTTLASYIDWIIINFLVVSRINKKIRLQWYKTLRLLIHWINWLRLLLLRYHTLELVGILILIRDWLLKVRLLGLMNILKFELNWLTNWDSSSKFSFVLKILIVLLFLHSKN